MAVMIDDPTPPARSGWDRFMSGVGFVGKTMLVLILVGMLVNLTIENQELREDVADFRAEQVSLKVNIEEELVGAAQIVKLIDQDMRFLGADYDDQWAALDRMCLTIANMNGWLVENFGSNGGAPAVTLADNIRAPSSNTQRLCGFVAGSLPGPRRFGN